MITVIETLIKQFENLFDPGTALGAFLISLLAGMVGSFFGGYKVGKFVKKRNVIDVSASIEGDITQDVHKVSNSKSIAGDRH